MVGNDDNWRNVSENFIALISLLIFDRENTRGEESMEKKITNFVLLTLIISHIEPSCAIFIGIQILQSPTPTQTLIPNNITIT